MTGIAKQMTLGQFAQAAGNGSLIPMAALGGGGGARKPPAAGPVAFPGPVGRIVQQIMLSEVRSHITSSQTPGGQTYRPLAHPRPNGGNVPLRDTGILLASLHAGHDSTSAWVATTHPGAALQNFGGTVRAKGKMLAIPLTKEAKRSGGPRRWTGAPLRLRPTRRNRVFLLMGQNGAGVWVGQFLLVDQITVPSREFMGLSSKAEDQIRQVILDAQVRGWLAA